MKKLSISLFAVLAIVFAVSSSFTTAKKRSSTTRWIYVENFVTPGVFQQSHQAGAFDQLATYQEQAIPWEGTPDQLICESGDQDLVCAILFEDDDVNGVQEAIDEAELPVKVPTESPAIFFRDI